MEAKTIEYWKRNAEEDYLMTPISVLRYISELEQLKIKEDNPKEQAERRVERFLKTLPDTSEYRGEVYATKERWETAKQCVTIALEDKITILKKIRKEIGLDISWIEKEEEVLKAIKEL